MDALGRMAKQTGPKTPGGKQRSSGNSVTNGCRSKQHRVLPSEKADEYAAVLARWMGEYGPKAAVDVAMVERLAQAEWRMLRCERQLQQVEAHLMDKPLLEWEAEDHALMTRARRYYSEALRFYGVARRDLDGMRLTRQREIVAICRSADALEAHGMERIAEAPGEEVKAEMPPDGSDPLGTALIRPALRKPER